MKSKTVFITLIILILIFLVYLFTYNFYHYDNDPRIYAHPLPSYDIPHKKTPECHNQVYTMLAIDGGGTRGVIPLYLLSKIEAETGQPIRNSFDLISGVSTGALIGTGLSIPDAKGNPKYTTDDLMEKYIHFSSTIFSPSYLRNLLTIDGIIAPRYSARAKYNLLQEHCQDFTIYHLLGHVLIVGVDSAHDKILTFCNWKHCSNVQYTYPLTNVLAGVTSPFSFFSPQLLFNRHKEVEYILNDAALIVANPSVLTYFYGKDICPKAKYYFLLSLGTGVVRNNDILKRRVIRWGALHWLPHVLADVISGQRSEAHILIKKIDKDDKRLIYVRISPSISAEHAPIFLSDKKDFNYMFSIAEQTYASNKSLFRCISTIVKTRTMSTHCKKVIREYQKNNADSS